MAEHRLHDLRIPRRFLFVARLEFLDIEIGEQPADLRIGELAPLDPGRGTDAFHGGNPA